MSEEEPIGRAKGGFARAEILDPERRSTIAQKAARARWDSNAPHATHEGELKLADQMLPVAVLKDGTRVLTSASFLRALGRPWKGSYKRTELPNFIDATNLSPFISDDLKAVLDPIEFRSLRGQRVLGYRAVLLPLVCDAYLAARNVGALTASQGRIAEHAEIVVRSLAKIGIIALVDEATGYQEVREKQALQAILDAYLRKELAAWAKKFPNEFYQQIYRLRGWNWEGRSRNPPQVVAHYTKDIVYARLAPHILDELEKLNPMENGRRRAKHHQWLTEDVGHPALAQHIHAVLTLMRISPSWDQFKAWLDVAHPKRGDTLQLPLMADLPISASAPLPLFEQSHDASLELEQPPEPSLL